MPLVPILSHFNANKFNIISLISICNINLQFPVSLKLLHDTVSAAQIIGVESVVIIQLYGRRHNERYESTIPVFAPND
jgi:uncharacterized membrane protein